MRNKFHYQTFRYAIIGLILLPWFGADQKLCAGFQDNNNQDSSPLPQDISSDWWGTVQKNIQQQEYHITWQDRSNLADVVSSYQAPNRAHDLRIYFTSEGIRVIPRTSENPKWIWGLELKAYSLKGCEQPVNPAKLVISGNRVEYQRGDLTEWYINDDRGLEQGFILQAPPKSERLTSGSWLVLKMTMIGDLISNMSPAKNDIDFRTTGGKTVLQYGQLYAFDKRGRKLPAKFGIDNGKVEIWVNTEGAVYPVTIDPLATTPNWTAEGNQDGAYFGWSVDTAGDVNGDGYSDVIIGARSFDTGVQNEGMAFVYHGSASGLSITADWTAESEQAEAHFGHSVATAGDVNGDGYSDIIIGATDYDYPEDREGAVFAYYGSAIGLGPNGTPANADWIAEGDQENYWMGISLNTAGDVNGDGFSDIIVGGYEDYEATALVFYGSAGGLGPNSDPNHADWIFRSHQMNADSENKQFVNTAGDVNGDEYSDVIIGIESHNTDFADEGMVFVFHGSSIGLEPNATPADADWTASGSEREDFFGHCVGTAGDVNGDGFSDIIVGARGYDNIFLVYHGSLLGLDIEPDWTVENPSLVGGPHRLMAAFAGDVNGDGFGDVVCGKWGSGDNILVYFGSATGLSKMANWSKDNFIPRSVATAGDINGDGYSDIILGTNDSNPEPGEGVAFVYHGSAAGLSTNTGWFSEGEQSSANFGFSVSSAGDVNGDGYSDVIVGAEGYDNGQSHEGKVFVYHGNASGLSYMTNWTAEGDKTNAYFGFSVGAAGDVNNDGYGDVIIGAAGYENGQAYEGRAFVYHGSASGLNSSANWYVESDQENAQLGFSIGTAGDVNGDGYSDVIVGAFFFSNDQDYEGRALVYHGSASGLNVVEDWSAEGDQTSAYFGYSVGTAGDVNGDGYCDVIVGAELYDNPDINEGKAFVYHGSALGLNTSADWTTEGNLVSAYFGCSVGTAGDVDNDGYSDVIVGAYRYSNGQADEGRVFVYHGSATGLNLTADWSAESDQNEAYFGRAVGTAGDVNGDGYSDVIVGADYYDNNETNEGMVFVYHGSSSGLNTTVDWSVESDQDEAQFGSSVGTAGDVNGDGYSDVIVGASRFDRGESDEGVVFLYYGNEGRIGLSSNPRQLQHDDSGPISPIGMSKSEDSFRIALLGHTPFGRGKVKLQWEVKPRGTLFDGTGLQESAIWYDTGIKGIDIIELVSGLSIDTRYHWRARLHYHPVTTPFQQYSRWFTIPWNGWQEVDLSTLIPRDVWVDDDYTSGGDNDGHTWGVDAFDNIQDGIDVVTPAGTVWVADGTYIGLGNKNLSFQGRTLSVKSINGPKNCIIDCENSGRGFLFENGEGQDSEVCGFIITNGNAFDGGAIRITNSSSVRFINCIISGNDSTDDGGAMYCHTGLSCIFINCIFADNHALDDGGAVHLYNTSPSFINCVFAENSTDSIGGGINSTGTSTPIVTNSILWDNSPSQFAGNS
ncbi:MAG: hypothetical protein GY869_13310, partial [Planctomycetes bacterium]|nr:hypothetical protein [Planctomycetota bacterium]